MNEIIVIIAFAAISVLFVKTARGVRRRRQHYKLWTLIGLYLVFATIVGSALHFA